MNSLEYDLIDKYLANELSEAERLTFEQRKANDPVFAEELSFYEMANQSLRFNKRNQQKDFLKQRDTLLDKKSKTNWLFKRLIIISILFILGFLVSKQWKVFFQDENANRKSHSILILSDSINQTKESVAKPDSMISPNQNTAVDTNSNKNKNNAKSDPPMAVRGISNDELYAENFKPYRDDLFPETRTDSELDTFDQFINDYQQEKYKEALISFDRLSPVMQKDDDARFIKANTLMILGKRAEAGMILEEIIKNKKSIHLEDAKWYLGLYYLKMKKIDKAKEMFKQINSKNNPKLKNKVSAILEKMK